MEVPVNREIIKTQYFLEDDLRETSYLLAPLYMCYTSNALPSLRGKVLVDGRYVNNCFLVATASHLVTNPKHNF